MNGAAVNGNFTDTTTITESRSENGKVGEVEVDEEKTYERYYDQQYEMLSALRPRIVGHFDLIRLMSSDPSRDVRRWCGVWERIERNLAFVASYGGWLECNSSALRKGLAEPYPCSVIAEVPYIFVPCYPLFPFRIFFCQLSLNITSLSSFSSSIPRTRSHL